MNDIKIPEWAALGKRVFVIDSRSFGIGSPAPTARSGEVVRVYKRYVIVKVGALERKFNYRPGIQGREFLESGGDVFGDWIVPETDEKVREWRKRRHVFDLQVEAKTRSKTFVNDPGPSTAYALEKALRAYIEAEESFYGRAE